MNLMMLSARVTLAALDLVLTVAFAPMAEAQDATAANGKTVDQQAELAKQLQNPVARLISVPLQSD